MRKSLVLTIVLIILLVIAVSLLIIYLNPKIEDNDNNTKYSCSVNSDCVSQCSRGCVNSDWALANPDTSECFRAWDCSCVDNQCYKDGKPQI
jgi:hypothetical protein